VKDKATFFAHHPPAPRPVKIRKGRALSKNQIGELFPSTRRATVVAVPVDAAGGGLPVKHAPPASVDMDVQHPSHGKRVRSEGEQVAHEVGGMLGASAGGAAGAVFGPIGEQLGARAGGALGGLVGEGIYDTGRGFHISGLF